MTKAETVEVDLIAEAANWQQRHGRIHTMDEILIGDLADALVAAKADATRWREVARQCAESLNYWTDAGCDCAGCQQNGAALTAYRAAMESGE